MSTKTATTFRALLFLWMSLSAPVGAMQDEANPVVLTVACGSALAQGAETIGLRDPGVFYREMFRPDAPATEAWFRAKPIRPLVSIPVDLPRFQATEDEDQAFRAALQRLTKKYRAFQQPLDRMAQLLVADLVATCEVAQTVEKKDDEAGTHHAFLWRLLAVEKFESLLLVLSADPAFFSADQKNGLAQAMHALSGDLFRFYSIDAVASTVEVTERAKSYPAWIVQPGRGHPLADFARKLGTRYRGDPFTLYLSTYEVVYTNGLPRGSNESKAVSLGSPIALLPGRDPGAEPAFRRLSEERRLASRSIAFEVALATEVPNARPARLEGHGGLHDQVAAARALRTQLSELPPDAQALHQIRLYRLQNTDDRLQDFVRRIPQHRQNFARLLTMLDTAPFEPRELATGNEGLWGRIGATQWSLLMGTKSARIQAGAGLHHVILGVPTGRMNELRLHFAEALREAPRNLARLQGLVWESLAEIKTRLEFADDLAQTLERQRTEVFEAIALFERTPDSATYSALLAKGASMETFETLQGTLRGEYAGTDGSDVSLPPIDMRMRSADAAIENPRTFLHLADAYRAATKPSARNAIAERIGVFAVARYAAGRGWTWRDRSRDNVGYDVSLADPKTRRRVFVEVKAFGDGQKAVKMTRNEVEFARAHAAHWLLATVTVDETGAARLELHRDLDVGGAPAATEEARSFRTAAFLSAGTPVDL